MSALSEVRLVAGREILERVRGRAFQVATVLLAVAAVAILVVARTLGGDDAAGPVRVAVTGAPPPALAELAGPGIELRTVQSGAAGRAALEDGTAELLIDDDAVVARTPPEPGSRVGQAAAAVAASAGTARALARPGIPPDAVRDALASARPLPVRAVEPGADDDRQAVAFFTQILLYLALIFAGYAVAGGVVVEKTSRVAEVLLTTLRPARLLAGKILGIGFTGLAQVMAAVVPVAVGLALLERDTLPGLSADVLAWSVLWFALGFAFYACAFAASAVLAGRQEDIGTVTIPVMSLLVAGYVLSVNAVDDPGGTLAMTLSFIPPFSPLVIPGRVATGEVPVWQHAVAIALTLAATALLVRAAARIYRGALLRSGARTPFRAAWRSAAG